MLSEEEKQRYLTKGEEFRKIREGVNLGIGFLEEIIKQKRAHLDNIRPVVPGADHECKNCGIVSMVYKERKSSETQLDLDNPPVYTPVDVYKCQICDYEEEIPSPTD